MRTNHKGESEGQDDVDYRELLWPRRLSDAAPRIKSKIGVYPCLSEHNRSLLLIHRLTCRLGKIIKLVGPRAR